MRLRIFPILTAFFLIGPPLFAHHEIKIQQKGTKEAIRYANICWQTVNNPKTKGFSTSDQTGRFKIENTKEEKLILSISCIGYKSFLDTIQVNQNPVIYLEKDMLNLDQVVVTGTRTIRTLQNTPVLTKVVTSTDIEQMGAHTALEALEFSMPGVQFSPDGHGDNLQIQGLDNNYILVLIDGQRMVGETRGNVNFSRINVDNIDRIEIINGASSVLYGSNAIGAVINIITKKTKKPFEASLGSQFSQNNLMHFTSSATVNQKKWGLGINAFRNSTDGYDLTPESPASFTVSPYVDYSFKLNSRYKFSKKTQASATGTYYHHELTNPPKSVKSTHGLGENYTLGGEISTQLNNQNTLVLKANTDFNNTFNIQEKKGNEKVKKGQYSHTLIQLTDHHEFNDKFNIVTGLEQNFEEAFSKKLFSGGLEDGGTTEKAYDFNAFTQIDYLMRKNLEIILAGRYSFHSDYKNHFTPKLSLMYSPGKFKIRGNIATGYRAPSLRELFYDFDHNGMFWIYGNPNLKPEESFYTSLSGEYTHQTFNANITVYRNNIEDKIETIDLINGDKLEKHHRNINQALLKGVESYVSLSFLQDFKLKLGYAYSNAEDKSTGLQLYGNSKHAGTSAVTYCLRNIKHPLTFNLSGRLSSGRMYQSAETSIDPTTGEESTSISDKKSDPYSIWKITYKQRFKFSKSVLIEINAGINNIFDYTDNKYQAVVDPGRRYTAGIKIFLF